MGKKKIKDNGKRKYCSFICNFNLKFYKSCVQKYKTALIFNWKVWSWKLQSKRPFARYDAGHFSVRKVPARSARRQICVN